MKKVSLYSAIGFALFSTQSFAQELSSPSFDNIGIHYANVKGFDESFSGASLTFEKNLPKNFFISGDLLGFSDSANTQISGINVNTKVESTLLHLNANYKFAETNGFVVYAGAGLSYLRVEATARAQGVSASESDSETGFNLLFGVRKAVTERLELDANFRHIDIADGDDQALNIAGRFFASERFSLNAGYTHIDSDFKYFEIGASYHF